MLKLYQHYGPNIVFSCGLALQQDFDWLINIAKQRIVNKPHNMELYFEEENFDGFLEKLNRYGVTYTGSVVKHRWGQRTVRFYDLDGFLIEVGESMQMIISCFLACGYAMGEI